MVPGVALLMTLAAPPSSDAADRNVTVARLDVRASPRCLTRDDIARRVQARTPRVSFADDAPVAAMVSVKQQRQSAIVAELTLGPRGAAAAPRRIVARSCAEAADAVALILAVTLDPTAQRTPARETNPPIPSGAASEAAAPAGPSSAGEPLSDSGSPASSGSAAAQPLASSPRATREPAPAAEQAKRPLAPLPPEPARSPLREEGAPAVSSRAMVASESAATNLEVGGALEGEAMFGAAPGVMPGISVSVLLASGADGIWAPAAIAGWSHVWRSGMSESSGTASFTLDVGRLGACPLRWRWSRLVVRPCASVIVGRMSARGTEAGQASASARPFSSAGLMVDARFGRKIELVARLGLGMTLVRDSYAFGDDVFYRAGPLTASVSLGLGLHWP